MRAVRFDWDPAKEAVNRRKHGLGFGEATALFTSGVEYLELPDVAHDEDEQRLIAIGPMMRGVIVVVFTERLDDTIRIISARKATRSEIAHYRRFLGAAP